MTARLVARCRMACTKASPEPLSQMENHYRRSVAKDPYTVLGVARGATAADIAAAWKARVVALHPDRYPGATTAQLRELHDRLAEVNAAFEALKDGTTPPREAQYARREHYPVMPRRPLTKKQRRFRWAVAGTVVVLLLAWLLIQNPSQSSPADNTVAAGWIVGNCVVGNGDSPDSVVPVRCAEAHIGKIIDIVYETSACPARTGGTVQRGAEYYCIDYEQ